MVSKTPQESESEFWSALHAELDTLVLAGNHGECRKILNSSLPRKVPRIWASRFGEIAFRVHHPAYTLKILHRFIYPENSFDPASTDREKIVYSSALYTFGAIHEALDILKGVSSENEPEAWFHMAGAHFCAWNYAAGIPFFKKYIHSIQVTPYKRLVGKVNLAAASIFIGDWDQANELLVDVERECEIHSYRLLLGNCYELKAQVQFFNGHYNKALELLDQALPLLIDQGGFYSLYAEKWMIICRCFKTRDPAELIKLEALRTKALGLGHWNTVRECELFAAIVTKNEDLIRKVIMGTPSELYRQRVRKLYGTKIIARGQYQLFLGAPENGEKDSDPCSLVFDPFKKQGKAEALYEKPLLFSLYNALTEDFYQPCNIGILFKTIYPGEKFNPYSSPARVLQLLRRLNKWFSENDCPLHVIFKKSEFRLATRKNILLTVQRGVLLTSSDGNIRELKNYFNERMFSSREACQVLEISKTSMNRLLGEALADGKLVKEKSGRGRPYYFPTMKQKKKVA